MQKQFDFKLLILAYKQFECQQFYLKQFSLSYVRSFFLFKHS